MSDTAAFLAGCAVTGVAVLFVMRNDFASSQTGVPPSLQPPSVVQPSHTPIPVPPSPPNGSQDDGRNLRLENELDQQRNLARDLNDQMRRQQERADELRNQLERQQRQTDDLKSQLERQERNTEILISRMEEQQRILDRLSDQPMRTQLPPSADVVSSSQSNHSDVYALITGAIGVVVLVVVAGGGLILFAIVVVVLFSTRRRRTRTVHIVHPFSPSSYAAMPPQSLLPARARTRPARQIDVEYYNGEDYD
ncbi:hypothetical protein C7B76_03765 [filamentous cyanobacterium CCP2]|nr:hypothetical protein C7B76_03765 [filamentous cyanobacterium CCP2]